MSILVKLTDSEEQPVKFTDTTGAFLSLYSSSIYSKI